MQIRLAISSRGLLESRRFRDILKMVWRDTNGSVSGTEKEHLPFAKFSDHVSWKSWPYSAGPSPWSIHCMREAGGIEGFSRKSLLSGEPHSEGLSSSSSSDSFWNLCRLWLSDDKAIWNAALSSALRLFLFASSLRINVCASEVEKGGREYGFSMEALGLDALLNEGVRPASLPGLSVSNTAVLVRFLWCESTPDVPESGVGVSKDCLLLTGFASWFDVLVLAGSKCPIEHWIFETEAFISWIAFFLGKVLGSWKSCSFVEVTLEGLTGQRLEVSGLVFAVFGNNELLNLGNLHMDLLGHIESSCW